MFRWILFRILNRFGADNRPGTMVCGTVTLTNRVGGTVFLEDC
jgi:hypothetical protein